MNEAYFVDTNILMYAVGSKHPLKGPCLELIKTISEGGITAVTDTEVFQEVAYRYWCQKKFHIAIKVLNDYETLFYEIYPVKKEHLKLYYKLLASYKFLSPRDAIHIAVMQAHQITQIYTADKEFTKLKFLQVYHPEQCRIIHTHQS